MTGPSAADPGIAVTAIVLAGGRSRRFGADKLAVSVDGRPLLERAISAVATMADEVVLVIAADGVEPTIDPAITRGVRLTVVRDAEPGGGPLAGLAAGLSVASAGVAVVVGGDQPSLVPGVLAALVRSLAGPVPGQRGVTAGTGGPLDIVVLEAEPPFRSLPAALRVAAAGPAAGPVLSGRRRSLVALYETLRVGILPAAEWRALDPEGATLRDVDRPEDVEERRPG